jgi:hypothetical protein
VRRADLFRTKKEEELMMMIIIILSEVLNVSLACRSQLGHAASSE